MNNKLTFVTAMYCHHPTERIGGRGYCFEHYKAPFKNILSLDVPLIIYSHEKNNMASNLRAFLEKENFKNYEIIIEDLETYKHNQKIFSLKEKLKIIDENGLAPGVAYMQNDRNYHLCLKKFSWLKEQTNRNPYNSEKFFWIDAGLFHHTIFPDSLGGMEKFIQVDPNRYWPICQKTIFKPEMAENLYNTTQDKFFCMVNTSYAAPAELVKLFNAIPDSNSYVVGGLFGGNKDLINYLNEKYEQLIDTVYENDILILEEPVLSILYIQYSELFKKFEFETWYHDCPGGPGIDRCCYDNTPNIRNFYKIFAEYIKL